MNRLPGAAQRYPIPDDEPQNMAAAQDAGIRAITQMNRLSFLHGTFIDGGAFTAGQTKEYAHKLRRPIVGVWPAIAQGGYGVFQVVSADKDRIFIQSQNVVSSVSFWVF